MFLPHSVAVNGVEHDDEHVAVVAQPRLRLVLGQLAVTGIAVALLVGQAASSVSPLALLDAKVVLDK